MQATPITMPTIYPALSYRDASDAIDWLGRAFGLTPLMVTTGADGAVAHAELRLGDGIVMLGTAQADRGWLSPRDLTGVSQTLYVVVADVDTHHARARAAGAEIVQPPYDTSYGSREYTARDCEGHTWSFGTYVPTMTPADR